MKTIFLISAIWFAAAAHAQQEYRIGWTRAQFDSAFRHYQTIDFCRLNQLMDSLQREPDTCTIMIPNYKIAGIKGMLDCQFASGRLFKTTWDVSDVTAKQLTLLAKHFTGKFGKPSKVYVNVDNQVVWVGKNSEIYLLKESELMKRGIAVICTRQSEF